MRGAIAAGHRLTAEAGAEILAEGGNAVDACLAAAFASWVAESTLTGPGGGGFMLVHRARDRTTRLLDFYVAIPGLGLGKAEIAEMESIEVDFAAESAQVFKIGAASCAVPGAPAGLEAAHRAYGSLPLARLIEPAVSLARNGIELTSQQAYLHAILDLILRHTDEGRAIYESGGNRLVVGSKLVMEDLAKTLEALAERGAKAFYTGELGAALVRHLQEHGGAITVRDLREYRVIRRRPVLAGFEDHQFESNPPPSSGGVLIGYGLQLLEGLGAHGEAGGSRAISDLIEVMREQARARDGRFGKDLYRGGLAKRLYAESAVREAIERMRVASPTLEPAPPSGTTHISVVDERGNAAALTVSTGSGSGVIVPGTGIQLNNMLGEFDLGPASGDPQPGVRLTSMMAPTVVTKDGRPRLVVGSAGSLRLRGAILQVIVNVIRHGMPVEEAISAPRVHVDDGHVHCEGGSEPAALDRLEALGYDLVRWRKRNLYFGGASAVEMLPDGSLAAAGDPRRGGHGIVVPA
ncbi:MAG: gamma-glutamyltransferase [Actinomycetota bacterium]